MKAVKRKYTLKVEIKIYHICFIDVSVEKMFFLSKDLTQSKSLNLQ